jgi:hypothetical protein
MPIHKFSDIKHVFARIRLRFLRRSRGPSGSSDEKPCPLQWLEAHNWGNSLRQAGRKKIDQPALDTVLAVAIAWKGIRLCRAKGQA